MKFVTRFGVIFVIGSEFFFFIDDDSEWVFYSRALLFPCLFLDWCLHQSLELLFESEPKQYSIQDWSWNWIIFEIRIGIGTEVFKFLND